MSSSLLPAAASDGNGRADSSLCAVLAPGLDSLAVSGSSGGAEQLGDVDATAPSPILPRETLESILVALDTEKYVFIAFV